MASITHRQRRSMIAIDLDAFEHNLRRFGEHLGGVGRVFAVLKANAYGHGAVACARAAVRCGVRRLMLATTEEAIELREAGIELPIHLLGTLNDDEFDALFEYALTPSLQNLELASRLSRACVRRNRSLDAHVNIDTGMGRLGFRVEQCADALDELRSLPGLNLTGLFTHLGEADDPEISQPQIEAFRSVCTQFEAAGIAAPLRHICNTTGAVLYPAAHADGARVGLGLYGMHDPATLQTTFPLRPVLSWTTRVNQIKDYPAGARLGYNGTFVTPCPSRIGILPVGYADGYPRACSNRARVLIRGAAVPVAGLVSMDYTMVDLTDGPETELGDTVTLVGRDGDVRVTAEELAAWSDTIRFRPVATGSSPSNG